LQDGRQVLIKHSSSQTKAATSRSAISTKKISCTTKREVEAMNIQPINNLLDRLDYVKQSKPDHWRAKCPIHQSDKSKSRSLSIVETESGSTLIHCFAGCAYDAVLDAIGLQPSDLFPKDEYIAGTKHLKKPAGKTYRRVIEDARGAATIVEVGARMLSRGETLDADDLIVLAGASEDLRGMLDV